MYKILAIANKELKEQFRSSMAYILLFIAVSVFNVFFFLVIDQNAEASLRDVFKVMEFLFVFIVPFLTMQAFSRERSSGTFEFLVTTPMSNITITLGKFIGAYVFFSYILILTFPYYIILEIFGNPDQAAIWTGYLGLWLEGGLFISIGLLTSSLTRSQVVAAISSYVIIFMLYFSISFIQYTQGTLEIIIRVASVWGHTENFISGILSIADVTYFITVMGLCLVLTRFSLLKRS